nr:MAG TPA: Endonuclease/Exonuclease/phosphatase family protein [Caudoviricetes sp.]
MHSKTTTSATVIVGGNFNTSRAIDWIAIGV